MAEPSASESVERIGDVAFKADGCALSPEKCEAGCALSFTMEVPLAPGSVIGCLRVEVFLGLEDWSAK